jgi:hypothetical protein
MVTSPKAATVDQEIGPAISKSAASEQQPLVEGASDTGPNREGHLGPTSPNEEFVVDWQFHGST